MKPVKPAAGQESVWDYPRPPRLEPVADRLRVIVAGVTIGETTRGHRVLETSHPPVYYLPASDVRSDLLVPAEGRSFCEFKGLASYWSLDTAGRRVDRIAWSYADPTPAFADITDAFAFYASKCEACFVGDELVVPQVGDFYGGWITARVVGPFKGGPGTAGW